MLGEMPKPLFGRDAGPELSEQRGDRCEGMDRLGLPLSAATLDEPKHAAGHRAGDQWGSGHHRGSSAAGPDERESRYGVVITAVNLHQFFAVVAECQGGVVTGERDDSERIRIGYIGARRPFRGQHRGVDVVVAVAQEAVVQIEVLD